MERLQDITEISIHPPRVGRDLDERVVEIIGKDFNPPAPGGAGPPNIGQVSGQVAFQSTRPGWGGTETALGDHRSTCISIHPPRVGRDVRVERLQDITEISIHPPRVGRDQFPLDIGV